MTPEPGQREGQAETGPGSGVQPRTPWGRVSRMVR